MPKKELDVKIEEQNKEVKSLIISSKKYFQITKKEDLIKATDLSVKVKSKLKELEEERKEYTDPLNQTLKKLNTTFKQLTEPLKEIEKQVKEAINFFREEEERKRIEREKQLRSSTNSDDLTIISDIPDIIEGNLGETRTVRRWSYKIIDENKIPRKYLTLDEKLINQEISNGNRKIPGLEIYQKITTSIYERK